VEVVKEVAGAVIISAAEIMGGRADLGRGAVLPNLNLLPCFRRLRNSSDSTRNRRLTGLLKKELAKMLVSLKRTCATPLAGWVPRVLFPEVRLPGPVKNNGLLQIAPKSKGSVFTLATFPMMRPNTTSKIFLKE
jgi:hypothetical protein